MMMGSLDEITRNKIINHAYVDFGRLIPKDKILQEEDHRMELICKGGSTFFVPVSDRESGGNAISNFIKWEQAFRTFSSVYTQIYPDRAPELIQYNQLIYTASLSFTWENVYHCDKEFRLHMSNYPYRNWGVILQQAWSVYLKDRVVHYEDKNQAKPHNSQGGRKKEVCKRFNKGKCNRGFWCDYEHRCLNCGKFGHGAHICRNNKRTGSNNEASDRKSDGQPKQS